MKIYDFNGKKNISGDRIREARLKRRLSQSDLAAQMQVEGIMIERDSVSRIEIGTRFIPDYELLFKGSKTGSYLTIEPWEGGRVPVPKGGHLFYGFTVWLRFLIR